MDSDTKKLLDWQQRVVETMYEHAGNLQSPYCYIVQHKWDELKQEAEVMQRRLQPRRWTVEVYEHLDGSAVIVHGPCQPPLNPRDWALRGRAVIVEGEGLE